MKSFLNIVLLLCTAIASAQKPYFQQQADFFIDVKLDDKEHSLTAFERIIYTNNSPDTLKFIWFHLWPDAYRNDKTAFSEQLLGNGRTDFYFSSPDQKGYINRLEFKVDGKVAETEDHPTYNDIVKLNLPAPLLPGGNISITTPFHIKLPDNFSRGGHVRQSYQVTQWFPKPAVYDKDGWHPMPYLDQGEFYAEYGDYDVNISVPANYVVAATGELQNPEELTWLRERLSPSYSPYKPLKRKPGAPRVAPVDPFPASSPEYKTIRYMQKNVHDFAWFADKRFLVSQDTMRLPDSRILRLWAFYLPSESGPWPQSLGLMKSAVRMRSNWLGSYPYNTLKAVEIPAGSGGGMEYPTITSISPIRSIDQLDRVLSHEIGHNWFYSLLGSDERRYPWMDEGINTYYDERYDDSLMTGRTPTVKKPGIFTVSGDLTELLLQTLYKTKRDQPINTPSAAFSESNYYITSYNKAADLIKQLEATLGTEVFDSAMRTYVRIWKNKHPSPTDLRVVFEDVSGKQLGDLFDKTDSKGSLFKPKVKRYVRPAFGVNLDNKTGYNYISFAPAAGINAYDGVMLGAAIHNYQLPPTDLQFYAIPVYGMKSGRLNGYAGASYNWYPGTGVSHIAAGFNAGKFTISDFENDDITIRQSYHKMVPFVKISFLPRDPRSRFEASIQAKSFFITEDELNFSTTIIGPDTIQTIGNKRKSRLLNQLGISVSDARALYPYSAKLLIEQQKGFLRTGLTANYFFNYANGENGLDLRFFAGKFIYLGNSAKTSFDRDRYFLNMSGANGSEDYTYSNYFYGRNKFEGFATQQMMIRDGGFKVRTDLLSNKIGKTDDWLIAMNFSTGIPKQINPLSVLPFRIPLSVFLDIGTNAEGWKKNAETDRFLFDGGIKLSLFKELVQIYVPFIYSKVYRDYFKSTLGENRFFKNVSFSINVQDFSRRKILNNYAF